MTMEATNNGGGLAGLSQEATGVSPAPVAFHLPAPPSTNALFKNVPGRGRVKTRSYDDWRMMAHVALRQQRIKNVDGRCIVVIGVERGSLNADIDNTIKATLDIIVSAGVLTDDKFVTAIAITWLPMANGLAHVTILPVAETDLTFHPAKDGASGSWIIAPSTQEQDHGYQPV